MKYIASLLLCCLLSCSTTEKETTVSLSDQSRLDNTLGRNLAERFETKLIIKKDLEVSTYLKNLAENLSRNYAGLGETPTTVRVIEDKAGIWKNYSLPGIKIYLSVGLLKSLELEMEVAAALAFELAHIWKRHVVKRLSKESPDSDANVLLSRIFPMPGDIQSGGKAFQFTEEELIESSQEAVKILYEASYDPRGMIAFFGKYKNNIKHSPYSNKLLGKLIEQTYRTIGQNPPLRNPIVRSEEFISIQKRIKKL